MFWVFFSSFFVSDAGNGMYRTEFAGFSNNVLSMSKALSVPTQYEKKKNCIIPKSEPFLLLLSDGRIASLKSKLKGQWWRAEKDTASCNSYTCQKQAHKAWYLSAVNEQTRCAGFKKKPGWHRWGTQVLWFNFNRDGLVRFGRFGRV